MRAHQYVCAYEILSAFFRSPSRHLSPVRSLISGAPAAVIAPQSPRVSRRIHSYRTQRVLNIRNNDASAESENGRPMPPGQWNHRPGKRFGFKKNRTRTRAIRKRPCTPCTRRRRGISPRGRRLPLWTERENVLKRKSTFGGKKMCACVWYCLRERRECERIVFFCMFYIRVSNGYGQHLKHVRLKYIVKDALAQRQTWTKILLKNICYTRFERNAYSE